MRGTWKESTVTRTWLMAGRVVKVSAMTSRTRTWTAADLNSGGGGAAASRARGCR